MNEAAFTFNECVELVSLVDRVVNSPRHVELDEHGVGDTISQSSDDL